MNYGTRLFFLGSLVVLGILSVVGVIGYKVGSSALIEESQNRLTQARLAKSNELLKDFESLNKSLLLLADHPGIQKTAQSKSTRSEGNSKDVPYELLKKIQKEFELHNILVTDQNGTLRKSLRPTFTLQNAPLPAEKMGVNFLEALSWTRSSPYFSSRFFDFSSSNQFSLTPSAYLAAPIYLKGQNIGSIFFQVSLQRIQSILSNENNWSQLGLKRTGEIVAFGPEGLLRNTPRIFYEDQNKIFRNHFQSSPALKINPAMRLGLSSDAVQSYLSRGDLLQNSKDYLGRPSVQSIGKIKILNGPEWVLVARMDSQEASVSFAKNLLWLLAACFVLLFSGYLIINRFSKRMLHPLKEISRSLSLFKGHQDSEKSAGKEWSNFQTLFENLNSMTQDYGELQKSKDFLERTMASLSEAIFIVSTPKTHDRNAKFTIVALNSAATRMIGVEYGKLKGDDLKNWVETDYALVKRSLNKPFEATIKKLNSDPTPLELSTALFPASDPSTQLYVIVGRDITWKKVIEKELILKEKLLNDSQSISKIGSFRWDIETGALLWSEEQYKILGFNPLEVFPSYDLFRNQIFQDDLSLFDNSLIESKKNNRDFQCDFRVRRANTQEIIWVRAHGRYEKDPVTRENVMYGTNQDITEMRRVEMSLIAAKDEALKSSQAKSEFLARMSHEIRTPMNAIMGMADLLSETDLNKDQRHYVTIFCKAGEVLMNLINDILDLSKIEAGEVSIENIPLDLKKLMTDVEDIMQPRALAKGLDYRFEICPDIGNYMMGDPNKLRQILINLVGNALKFTAAGEVLVVLKKNPDLKNSLQISVSDSGVGIPADKQHLIFQKFSQADSSITRRFGGTGLGLAICKSLVELMGGRIWFESQEKVGTTFFMTVPYHEPILNPETGKPLLLKSATPLIPVPLKRKIHPGRKLRILIADDTCDNRTLFTHFLKSEDFEIIEAENGAEALSKVQNDEFDIVFMDVQMPVMDGYAATMAIRKWELDAKMDPLPIVALTAHALSEDRQKSIDMGCNDHVAKPFRKDTLLRVINRYST